MIIGIKPAIGSNLHSIADLYRTFVCRKLTTWLNMAIFTYRQTPSLPKLYCPSLMHTAFVANAQRTIAIGIVDDHSIPNEYVLPELESTTS
ncbi:MAG: hypothetical protein ABFS45_24870 [Pseudomonadota bacterium]